MTEYGYFNKRTEAEGWHPDPSSGQDPPMAEVEAVAEALVRWADLSPVFRPDYEDLARKMMAALDDHRAAQRKAPVSRKDFLRDDTRPADEPF